MYVDAYKNNASFAWSICGSQLYFVYWKNVTLPNVKLMLGH